MRAKMLSLPGVVCDGGELAGSFRDIPGKCPPRDDPATGRAARTRLDAAEDVLTAAEASLKQAHTRFDAADEQVAVAEDALHAAYAGCE
jgi:hypothetical protein